MIQYGNQIKEEDGQSNTGTGHVQGSWCKFQGSSMRIESPEFRAQVCVPKPLGNANRFTAKGALGLTACPQKSTHPILGPNSGILVYIPGF